MPVKKLPINEPPYQDVPDVALSFLASLLINGHVYPLKAEKKYLTMNRPGLDSTPFCDLSITAPIDGLWWWPAKKVVLATCNGRLFSLNQLGTATELTGATITAGRTNFTQATEAGVNKAFGASGGLLFGTDNATAWNPQGLGVPAAATHVAFMDDRLIANEKGTGQFKWTQPGIFTADVVTGTDGNNYMCIEDHIASASSPFYVMDYVNGTIDPTGHTFYSNSKTAVAIVSSVTITSGSYGTFPLAAGVITLTGWNGLAFDIGTGTNLSYYDHGLHAEIPFAQGTSQPVISTGSSSNEPITGGSYLAYWQLTTATANKTWTVGDSYSAGWAGLNFATLAARGDELMALDARFDMITLVGRKSIEYWYNDGVSPFAKYEGTTSEVGTMAVNSFIFDGNLHWMLDSDRNLIMMVNRAPKVVSNPFASILENMQTVADCFSLSVKCDGRDFLVLTFPTANFTLAYDVENGVFQGQWGTWNQIIDNFDRWIANAFCKCPDWGFSLAGDYRTGKIYKISQQYATDADQILKVVKRTGWVDYGIKFKKRSDRIRLTLKRGVALTNPVQEAAFTVKSRVDGSHHWGPERTGSLGLAGDTAAIVEFRQNGIFRMRQDEYSFSDAVPLVLVDAEEEITVLSR